MFKSYAFLCLSLIASISFANPCNIKHRSCLKLKNQHDQSATVACNWLNPVSASSHSQGSTQLDLGYGDGLGAPEPRTLSCSISTGGLVQTFELNNPYWGSVIEFNLLSEKQLVVRVIDGWSSKEKQYSFRW